MPYRGGLTVAELIAKIGGSTADRPRRHHAAPDPEPPEPDLEQPGDELDDGYDAYAVSASPAYAMRGPTWRTATRATRPSRDAEQTTVLPKTPRRTRPTRTVDEPAADEMLTRSRTADATR